MAIDILMAISDQSGSWIAAQSQSATSTSTSSAAFSRLAQTRDILSSDLQEGRLFEIENFKLSVGLESSAEASDMDQEELEHKVRKIVAEEAMRAAINEATKQGDQQRLKALKAAAKKKTSKRKFAKWISHRDGGGGPRRFPLDFQEFSFTRQMDLASTALFEACCNSYTLKKAVLLKRKSTGDGLTMGYLRLDFTDILITSLDWDVDDTIQENIKFICRGVEVKYRRQLNTGRLGESESRSWSARDETY